MTFSSTQVFERLSVQRAVVFAVVLSAASTAVAQTAAVSPSTSEAPVLQAPSVEAPVNSVEPQDTPRPVVTELDNDQPVMADAIDGEAANAVLSQESEARGNGVESAATETAEVVASERAEAPVTNTNDGQPAATSDPVREATDRAMTFLRDGGPSIWAIAALSVVTVALILWKIWRLALIGAWSRGKARKAVEAFEQDAPDAALAVVKGRRGLRSIVVASAIQSRVSMPEEAAREETSRVAKNQLGEAGVGLRALELIATIAPLLGLLGTVLGMIAAFQALQESGSQADPSQLAGGIWEALLTTAAGMAVAIPASAALTWFEAVLDRMRRDVEDAAMRIFVHQRNKDENALKLAAE